MPKHCKRGSLWRTAAGKHWCMLSIIHKVSLWLYDVAEDASILSFKRQYSHHFHVAPASQPNALPPKQLHPLKKGRSSSAGLCVGTWPWNPHQICSPSVQWQETKCFLYKVYIKMEEEDVKRFSGFIQSYNGKTEPDAFDNRWQGTGNRPALFHLCLFVVCLTIASFISFESIHFILSPSTQSPNQREGYSLSLWSIHLFRFGEDYLAPSASALYNRKHLYILF